VIRIVLLLCICLAGPAHAQGTGFDVDAMANVQTEAIDFMLPRTMEVVTAAQLAMWGLTGLTSIDPALSATVQDSKVQLLVHGRSTIEVTVPGTDAAPWGQAIAKVVAAAYAASPAIRQAGQAVVTKVLLNEMLAHLDPYSRYIPPIEAVDDRDRRVGHAGIGVTFIQHGRAVTVHDVVIGSPAALAGMRPGDAIQWVDEHTAIGKNRDVVEALLNGPEGTELRLGWRARDGSSHVATMTRVMIPPETVFPRRVGDVAIIQITGFSQTTDQHVIQVVRDDLKEARPITGIVLDLRGNRGGLVRAAVATADTFLPAGVVMRSSGRAPETNRIWRSGGGELARGVPMVVLVDGGTASAAEILAAALADRGRAVVVGSSTFGKGVVQTIDPLPDGGELFLTWSRILAPRYWPIQSLGVFPQICTSLGDAAVRTQLDALADGRLELAKAIEAHRAARAPLSPDQIVAIRGRCPAADPREADIDVAEALVETPASYAAALLPPMADEQ
jgi:carboxyl-terminal processing protease